MEAEAKGFVSPFWMTFQQARELGGSVKKGEHGSPVVYASKFTKKDKNDAGDEIEQEIPFLKEYTVFSADQIEGLPSYFYELTKAVQSKPLARIEQAERFFANTKADISTGGNRAYYAIEADYVQIPRLECFRDSESHAATLAHELTHNAACRIMPHRSRTHASSAHN
jgi:antirestriction protein ArdC